MKRIRTGITQNSITVSHSKVFYAVGYRNNIYDENEWAIRFTPSYDNALAYIENEKQEHPTEERLKPEYEIWKFSLQDGQPMLTKVKETDSDEIDY